MPTLDFRDSDLHTPEAGAYLDGVMHAPNETTEYHWQFVEAIRDQAITNVLRRRAGESISKTSEAMDMVAGAASGPRLSDMVGLLNPAALTQGRFRRGEIAGRLLLIVLVHAEHDPSRASKESAYKIYRDAAAKAHLADTGRVTLLRIFDDFEPAAHFWTSRVIAPEIWRDRGNSGAHLARFIGFADTIRAKGEAVKLDQGSLLDPTKTWTVPARFVLPKWEIPMPSPAELAESMARWAHLSASV